MTSHSSWSEGEINGVKGQKLRSRYMKLKIDVFVEGDSMHRKIDHLPNGKARTHTCKRWLNHQKAFDMNMAFIWFQRMTQVYGVESMVWLSNKMEKYLSAQWTAPITQVVYANKQDVATRIQNINTKEKQIRQKKITDKHKYFY